MKRVAMFLGVIAVSGILCLTTVSEGEMHQKVEEEADMMLHHLHVMMNHGITMVTEGSNLVMIAGMKMAEELDRHTKMHGQLMISKGKKVIQRSLAGSEMKGLMKGELADSPLMQYTHALGKAMLDVITQLEKMDIKHMSSAHSITMHHMHISLNHALQMASQGANMIMFGQMGMAGDVDTFSINHGKTMIADARALYTETMEGDAVRIMHGAGATPENSPLMKMTYDLAEVVSKAISLLEKMPR